MKDKGIKEVMDMMARLETIEFIGLARLLKVSLVQENDEDIRPFADIVEDMLVSYNKQNRKRRREIFKMLKNATKNRDYYKQEAMDNGSEN